MGHPHGRSGRRIRQDVAGRDAGREGCIGANARRASPSHAVARVAQAGAGRTIPPPPFDRPSAARRRGEPGRLSARRNGRRRIGPHRRPRCACRRPAGRTQRRFPARRPLSPRRPQRRRAFGKLLVCLQPVSRERRSDPDCLRAIARLHRGPLQHRLLGVGTRGVSGSMAAILRLLPGGMDAQRLLPGRDLAQVVRSRAAHPASGGSAHRVAAQPRRFRSARRSPAVCDHLRPAQRVRAKESAGRCGSIPPGVSRWRRRRARAEGEQRAASPGRDGEAAPGLRPAHR